METSKLIDQFFEKHDNSRNSNNFWDFVYEVPLYDAQYHGDMGSYEAFNEGCDLAIKAAGKPIYCFHSTNLDLYFIGSEKEIMEKLESKAAEWLKTLPPPKTKETVLQEQLEQE